MTKIKKCPHCKSKKGFRHDYLITGYGYEIRNFNGDVIDANRETFDKSSDYVECLNCGKPIDSEKVDI